MDHAEQQRAHFGNLQHDKRLAWQTQDTFVRERELATIRPLVDGILMLAKRHNRPLRVLESGCGQGVNLLQLAEMGIQTPAVEMQGVDFTPEAIETARKHGLNVQVANGLALPFPDATFDVVFTRDVLHHVANDAERQTFVAEMERVTRPGGFFMAIEPNVWNPMIFGLSVLVHAERGIQKISEARLTRLIPGATVVRTAPSAAWRGWYHYRSPFYTSPSLAPFARACLRQWERLCRRLPTFFWAWRVYRWEKGMR